ncbi:non-structural maintenance of chromosomes element 4 homolog A-like [Mizuhopecten yessoensis]|uniref:Non-structural maintenance of chromosomes element 4 n=1 Tax=Mizuhopecten yessoensis TaxID=6573 RepID=A0A210R2F1_MIZYE|nr:non-structural maintenance of chromosomes element 4 homolog A-like [Mizuhopecten yessoensis]OWF55260.1 Non-structural maintenance of chromosomes element 4-like A [Mizuhopecten yessoensis]
MARERNKRQVEVATQEEDDEADGEEYNSMQYLQFDQNRSERLRVRHDYRVLIEDIQKNTHDMINPESKRLQEVLDEANSLNKEVRMPREGALDSQAVLLISNLSRQKAEALHTDFVKFEPIEFAEKLITFVDGGADRQMTPQNWVMLGSAVQKFFKKSPAFHFMGGSFERLAVPKMGNKRPPKLKEKDNLQEKATVPKQLNNFGEGGRNEGTTQEVERVFGLLKKYYKNTNNQPICYFEFVLNPDSFGQTVENVFYASFLVRDGHARIYLDDDRLPLIEPISDEERNAETFDKMSKHQAILSITPAEWKELVEVYKVEIPLIPTRDQTTVTNSRTVMSESTSNVANSSTPNTSRNSRGNS